MKEPSDICTIGAGYLGVPFSALISHHNNLRVTIVDKDEDRLKTWLKGPAIDEPGLMSMKAWLNFTDDIEGSIKAAKLIFVAVNSRSSPVPKHHIEVGSDDLDEVIDIIRDVSVGHKIVVIKSTISCERAEQISGQLRSHHATFTLLTNPEFHAQGTAIEHLKNPDHLVLIGSSSEEQSARTDVLSLRGLYLSWVKKDKIQEKSWETVALVKLASNAIRAQQISTINTLSTLCEKIPGIADITDVSSAMRDLGIDLLEPGLGFGGTCLGRDTTALVDTAAKLGLKEIERYWKGVSEINEDQQERVLGKIIKAVERKQRSLKPPRPWMITSHITVCVLGPSFKAGNCDLRNPVSERLIIDLLGLLECYVRAYQAGSDRIRRWDLRQELERWGGYVSSALKESYLQACYTIDDALLFADVVIVLNREVEYINVDWKQYAQSGHPLKVLFDVCNCLPHKTLETLEDLGVEVVRLGAPRKRTLVESPKTAP